ncbi:MAG: hypothetical protein CBC48_14495 [bacterium TMED88]|nr:diguanylate cyclase [Deltaproteobacteria bacterium]OUV27272.1 MAG: hypothetical protein CBC48_14495 [bacterium TMED88]
MSTRSHEKLMAAGDHSGANDSEGPLRVLLIDDSRSNEIAPLLEAATSVSFETTRVHDVEAGLQRLVENQFDAVLLDLSLEESQGTDTLAPARVAATVVPFVVFDTEEDENLALRAHRFGAQDYLVKSECDSRLLVRTIRHARERARVLQDLARARQYEHYLATHDVLTGLPNRLASADHLRRALASALPRNEQVALLFLDLDRFKNINDSLGHKVGDQLLVQMAGRLSRLMGPEGFLARIGGDEFVIILQRLGPKNSAKSLAAKIANAMMQPFVLDEREYRITTSVGIAIAPEDGSDSEMLMRHADTAMYHAKSGGANRHAFFSDSLNHKAQQRFDIENGLLEALANNSLSLHFQPQVDIGLGLVSGAEAMVQWQHAERGLIPPSEFMHYAEDAGLVGLLGQWVLKTACQQVTSWPTIKGQPIQLCVPVPSQQLCDEGFPETVMRSVRDSGLQPSRLTIGISEHSILHDAGATLGAVRFLRDFGCRVVVDDFGTGHSAMSALKTLPIDGIKIDRSFIAEIVDSTIDASITKGLISIARGLELSVTAEGVENREQLDLLFDLGVHHMQGDFFGKPAPSAEFAAQIRNNPDWFEDEDNLPC